MARAHLFRPLTDATGLLLTGATVTIIDPETNSLLGDPIFVDDSSSATLTNPFQIDSGYIDFYLARPRRIQLVASQGQTSLGVFLDVYPPAEQVVVGSTQIRIVNTPVPGSVLVASQISGEALWLDTAGLQPPVPIEAPHFRQTVDTDWTVTFTPSGNIFSITITIPAGNPWDASSGDAAANLSLATFSAAQLDGRDPQAVDYRVVDLAAETNTYTYSVTCDDLHTLYWIEATDYTGAVVFDWRRG